MIHNPPGTDEVQVRELIGWPLDSYSNRDTAISPHQLAAACDRAASALSPFGGGYPALHAQMAHDLGPLLSVHLGRSDLQRQYADFDWTLGVVDLHRLVAFQRRLILDSTHPREPLPEEGDWPSLLTSHSTVPVIRPACSTSSSVPRIASILPSTPPTLTSNSYQPPTATHPSPLSLTGGTSFFEVARHDERWFLRDGYHRAYHLLGAAVCLVIAVILRVGSMAELGAVQPWFFPQADLLSERPPLLIDFHDDRLTLTYSRSRQQESIHIRIQETLEPIHKGEQS